MKRRTNPELSLLSNITLVDLRITWRSVCVTARKLTNYNNNLGILLKMYSLF